MPVKLSNLSDDVKLIHEYGFPIITVAEIKEYIRDYGFRYQEDTWFLSWYLFSDSTSPNDVFGDEVELDIVPEHFEFIMRKVEDVRLVISSVEESRTQMGDRKALDMLLNELKNAVK